MSLYSSIVAWSAQLPAFMRDALRRLVQKDELADADIEELTAICRAEHSLVADGPKSVPLALEHVPDAVGGGEDVRILRVEANRNVKALQNDQKLTVAEGGLTVVYGDNGAGKSGFARIIKQTCKARGEHEPVLPDVFAKATGVPTADLVYRVGEDERVFPWSEGAGAPLELSGISVFDARAVKVYVDKPNEIAWQPAGLDLIEKLADASDGVKALLKAELAALEAQRPQLPALPPETTAGAFLVGLSHETDPAALEVLRPSDDDVGRREELRKLLTQKDPAKEAAGVRAFAERVRVLLRRVSGLEKSLGITAIQELGALHAGTVAAVEAAKLASEHAFAGETVSGIGEPAWLAMWQAAEAFATSGATSDGLFPSQEAGARCVLCLQPLAGDAPERLRRFREFVRDRTSQDRDRKLREWNKRLRSLHSERVREETDAGLLQEIRARDENVASVAERFLTSAESVLASLPAPEPLPDRLAVVPLPAGCADALDGFVRTLQAEAAQLDAAADPELRGRLKDQLAELLARADLVAATAAIRDEIARLQRVHGLTEAIRSTNTKAISTKGDEFTRELVDGPVIREYPIRADLHGRPFPRTRIGFLVPAAKQASSLVSRSWSPASATGADVSRRQKAH